MRARWVALVGFLLVVGLLVGRWMRAKPGPGHARGPGDEPASDVPPSSGPATGPHPRASVRPGPVDPTTGLRGVVLGPDRRPRAEVVVLVAWLADLPDGGFDEAERDAVTGTDGEFAWDLSPGTYYVGATSSEGVAGQTVSVDQGKIARVELVLDETAVVLSGQVSDSLGGPIAGALVTCRGPIVVAAKTDADGAYTMHLAADVQNPLVSVTAGGYVPGSTVTQVIDGRARADFVLDPTASVRGRVVTTAGSPAGAASVWLESGSRELDTVAGGDGNFEVRDVPPGSYTAIGRRGSQVGAAPGALWVEVGASVDGVTIVIAEGHKVSGTVRDDAGRTVAGAVVGLHDALAGISNSQIFTTQADGGYAFVGVAPGEVSLIVTADGYDVGDRARATVTMAGEDLVGIDLVLDRETGARIRGRVVDASGQPVGGASVSYELDGDAGPVTSGVMTSEADGTFSIHSLAPGTCTLTASAPPRGYGKLAVTVADGEDKAVELALKGGGELRGTVRWQGGAPASGVYVRTGIGADPNEFFSGTPAVRTAGDGSFVLRDVEPGKNAVKASRFADDDGLGLVRRAHVDRLADGVRPAVEYDVEPGETVQGIELVLARGGHTIAGAVAGAAGEALVGAEVHVGTETERKIDADGRAARASADGTFRFDDLDDGTYAIWATCREGPGAPQLVRTDAVKVRLVCAGPPSP